ALANSNRQPKEVRASAQYSASMSAGFVKVSAKPNQEAGQGARFRRAPLTRLSRGTMRLYTPREGSRGRISSPSSPCEKSPAENGSMPESFGFVETTESP